MNVFVYTRKNVNNLSVEEQLRLCRQYAEEHGHTIVSEYIERSTSTAHDMYSTFEKMLRESRGKDIQAVLVPWVYSLGQTEYVYRYKRGRLFESILKLLFVEEPPRPFPPNQQLELLADMAALYLHAKMSQERTHKDKEYHKQADSERSTSTTYYGRKSKTECKNAL